MINIWAYVYTCIRGAEAQPIDVANDRCLGSTTWRVCVIHRMHRAPNRKRVWSRFGPLNHVGRAEAEAQAVDVANNICLQRRPHVNKHRDIDRVNSTPSVQDSHRNMGTYVYLCLHGAEAQPVDVANDGLTPSLERTSHVNTHRHRHTHTHTQRACSTPQSVVGPIQIKVNPIHIDVWVHMYMHVYVGPRPNPLTSRTMFACGVIPLGDVSIDIDIYKCTYIHTYTHTHINK